jgi:BirA family biotin operon repressor/biotin-[acetyl-CoA-carboxylase] ligase
MATHGLNIDTVREALAGRVVGGRILWYDKVTSTMDEARRLADEGRAEGLVVGAGEQTAGRGRFDRRWVSPAGSALLFSVLLRPQSSHMPYVNMAATLAVADAVAAHVRTVPAIKWPNDVRIGGLKVSGILIETDSGVGRLRYALVGIGINVDLDVSDHPEIAETATSVNSEASEPVDHTTLLLDVLKRLDDMYASVRAGDSLTHEWASRLETLGRYVQVSWGHRQFEGTALEVDERGNLIVERDDGTRTTVAGGEVTLRA